MILARLYDDLVMDHIKNARNYRILDNANRKATGSNPLCGDELTVYLAVERDRIQDIAFLCTCCGISMASASIMKERVKGETAADARSLLRSFVSAVLGGGDLAAYGAFPGQRAILATAQEFPARTRCAALPWATLEGALDGREETVFVR